jgi:hypothetical protein
MMICPTMNFEAVALHGRQPVQGILPNSPILTGVEPQ